MKADKCALTVEAAGSSEILVHFTNCMVSHSKTALFIINLVRTFNLTRHKTKTTTF